MGKGLILIVDDEPRHRQLYSSTLEDAGFEVDTAASADEAIGTINRNCPAMLISDVRMPGMDGVTFLKTIRADYPELPTLLITAYPDIRDAVQALKLGAVDYLEKPVDLDELVAAVSDTLGVNSNSADLEIPAELMKGLVAESPIMRAILKDAYRVAKSDATVMITGESGSGKEVLAEFIHKAGNRAGKPFVALNCAAIPHNILASELFGHKKGAFTGASANRDGLFRKADKGTLFLDEIGDMPLELQPALLRAIETGRISPVGMDSEIEVDFRLIAATNRNLMDEVKNGNFREDLFYRLNVISFEVPPLRKRPEDIMPLARFFLAHRAAGTGLKRLSPAAAKAVQNYSWTGNVRELANAMERAAILSNTEIILPDHLPASVVKSSCEIDSEAASSQVKTMEQAELEAIKNALDKTGGNRTKAAELLGISRRALLYKIKRFNF